MMRKSPAIVLMSLVVVAAAAVAGCPTGHGPSPTPAMGAGTTASDYEFVLIGGNVSPVTVTYEDMMAMAPVEMKNTTMVKMNGARVTSDREGAALADILAKAGLPASFLTIC